ncbi:hypothetical protein KAI54_03540, partial [Candidatus Gracilibacteria bacterium]|nr:hypothetical protein [Candidatus Gracilibacteria bacterium]
GTFEIKKHPKSSIKPNFQINLNVGISFKLFEVLKFGIYLEIGAGNLKIWGFKITSISILGIPSKFTPTL